MQTISVDLPGDIKDGAGYVSKIREERECGFPAEASGEEEGCVDRKKGDVAVCETRYGKLDLYH